MTLKPLAFLLIAACLPLASAAEKVARSAPTPVEITPLATAKVILYEDFESTEPGQIPKGYTKKGSASVVAGVSHSGTKSLRLDAAVNGARWITKTGEEIATLGGQHWGRLYFKVQLPTPTPADPAKPIVHMTMVGGTSVSPLEKDPVEVRVLGTMVNATGGFCYLYNVQPRGGRKEFAFSTKWTYHYTDEWTLAEWYVDYATQAYRLFINGDEVADMNRKNGENNFAGIEIPAAWESMSFGWCNYQPATAPGFVGWIDDIALSKERIGGQLKGGAKANLK